MSKHFKEVFQRDNYRCVYCCQDMMVDFDTFMIIEEDHLLPLSQGGEDIPENVVIACAVCNMLKGDYAPGTKLTEANRIEYIAEIRKHIMSQRANKMKDYASWTHSSN